MKKYLKYILFTLSLSFLICWSSSTVYADNVSAGNVTSDQQSVKKDADTNQKQESDKNKVNQDHKNDPSNADSQSSSKESNSNKDQQKKVNKYAVSGQKARKRLFVQRRQVVKTNEHQQSSTTSKSDNSRVSSDHQSNPSSSNTSGRTGNESKQVHNYLTVSNKVKTNYYMQVRKKSHTNYKIYKTGGYNTSQINLKPIDYSKKYRGKKVHVLASENTSDGRTWLEIYLGKKFVGWINANSMDKNYYNIGGVPLIGQRQQLPTGCEITAVTMMLNYAGDKSSKMKLAKEMPRSSNPNKGFVGSPYSSSGWYIYPAGLMNLVKRHVGSARNLTGTSLTTIKKSIRNNHPVVMWLAPLDGFSNHALTVYGYTNNRIYLNDPWKVKRVSFTNKQISKLWRQDAYRALSY